MVRFVFDQNPLDAYLALPGPARLKPTQIIKKCLYYEFPVIPLIKQQRTIARHDRVLRDIPLLIKVTRDLMAERGDLDGRDWPLGLPLEYSLQPDPMEELSLQVSRALSPAARSFVLFALQDYDRAGRIEPLQAAASEEVRNMLSGPGEQPENLFSMLREHPLTCAHPDGTEPFLSLLPVRTWVMANFHRNERDTEIWALLLFLETGGMKALSRRSNEKQYEFDRDWLAAKMNSARIGLNGNSSWSNEKIRNLCDTLRHTMLPKLKDRLSETLAAE